MSENLMACPLATLSIHGGRCGEAFALCPVRDHRDAGQ